MDGLSAGDLAGGDDRGDVQIALRRRRRADADAFVGKTNVHGLGVGLGVDGDRGDAHLLARAVNAQRDLAAVGDEDFFEHARYSITTRGSPNSTGWASSTRISGHDPALRGRDRVHRLHRLDDEQRLALAHPVADAHERVGVWLGPQVDGADHRRLDLFAADRRLDRRGGRRRPARPARARRRRARRRRQSWPRRRRARATRIRRPSPARPRSRSGRSR